LQFEADSGFYRTKPIGRGGIAAIQSQSTGDAGFRGFTIRTQFRVGAGMGVSFAIRTQFPGLVQFEAKWGTIESARQPIENTGRENAALSWLLVGRRPIPDRDGRGLAGIKRQNALYNSKPTPSGRFYNSNPLTIGMSPRLTSCGDSSRGRESRDSSS